MAKSMNHRKKQIPQTQRNKSATALEHIRGFVHFAERSAAHDTERVI